MPEQQSFTISYDGPALASHEIEIKDIAPALLGLSAALEEASRLMNGNDSSLSVKLKAGVKEGSVEAEILCQLTNSHWWEAAKTFALSDDAKALQYYFAMIGIGSVAGGYKGLIWILKKLKGKKPTKIENLPNGQTIVTLPDGTTIETYPQVALMLNSSMVRKGISEAITVPLKKPGIEKMSFRKIEGNQTIETSIPKAEADSFAEHASHDEVVTEKTVSARLKVVSVSFQEGYKWRFTDGDTTFAASILDETFLARTVNQEETFTGGDFMNVKLRIIEHQIEGMLPKFEYEVLEVIGHERSPIQLRLPTNEN